MIFRDWVLTYLCNAVWQIPMLWLMAALIASWMRRVSVRAEQRVWVLALLSSAVMPGCSISGLFAGAGGGGLGSVTGAIESARVTHSAGLPQWARDAIFVVYLMCLAGGAVRLITGLWRLRGFSRRAESLALSAESEQSWRRIVTAYGLRRVRLAKSPEITTPVALGIWTPTVLLPMALTGKLGTEELDAALAHEGAHLSRADFTKHIGYTLVSLPVAMHPATWMVKARLAECREMVCDERAACMMRSTASYMGALLRLAALLPIRPIAYNTHAIGMFDANTLERRVLRMVKQRRGLKGMRRAGVCLVGAVIGLVTLSSALALHVSLGTVAKHGGGPVYTAGGDVAPPTILYSVDPSFPDSAGKAAGGVCVLKLIVNTSGKPEDVHVVRSIRPDFDGKALEAVRQFRFKPGTRKGEAVAVAINIEVNFQRF